MGKALGSKRILLAGLLLAVFYWVFETVVMDALIFGRGSVGDRLLPFPGEEGHELWMRLLTVALIVGFAGALQVLADRSERERAALRESEARFQVVVDTAPNAIITMGRDGRIKSFNASAERIFGYTAAEAVGQPLRMLMPERLREPHEKGFRRYLQTGEPHVIGKGPVELAGLRKGGEEFPIELSLGKTSGGDDGLFTGVIRDISERKRAEQELRDNERRLRHFFEQSVDALLVHDESGRVVDCNTAAHRSLGYTREELLGLSVADIATNLATEEQRRSGDSFWQRALAGEPGQVVGVHRGEHRRKDGTTFPVEVRVSPLDYWGRRLILASARDVTERVEAERELREAEARFRSAFDQAQIGMSLNGLDGRFLRVNRALCEMLGYSGEELLATDFLGITPAEDQPVSEERFRRLLEGRIGGYTIEKRYFHAGGHLVWISLSVSLVRNPEGDPLYVVAQMQDITDRKAAEERLRRAQERYRALVEHMPALVYTEARGEAGTTTYMSPQCEDILGYTAERWISTPGFWQEVVHPEDRERVLAEDERTHKSGEPFRAEYRVITGDGRIVWVRDEAMLVRDGGEDGGFWQGVILDITDRKEAELELRLRDRAVAASSNGLLITDPNQPDNPIIYVNPAFETMTSYTVEEALGRNCRFLQGEDRDQPPLDELRAAIRAGRECQVTLRNYRKDGALFWNELSVSPVYDEEGRLTHFIGVQSDVTDRKKAEEEIRELNRDLERRVAERTGELRQSEERYRLVVDAANDGVFDWDIRAGGLYWNDRIYEIVGLTRPEVEPSFDLFMELVHPDDREKTLEALRKHLEEGEEYEIEFRLRHSSGEYRYCVGRGKAQRDESGVPIRMAGTVTDVTERKEAERRLRESEERFRALVQNASDIITILDTEGQVIYESPAVERVLGHEPRTFSRDTAFSRIHPQDTERLFEVFMELAQVPGESRPVEFRFRHADGSWRYLDAVITNLVEHEAIGGIVINSRDVTERKEAEEEVRKLNESLERRVQERTGQLRDTVAELEAAREAAEAANRAKSEFLANMSHEIRTPMNGVIGMTELLLDTELSEEQREYTETVKLSGESLLSIINDILDFSKIEAGKMELESVEFEPGTVLEEVVSLLAERAHEKGLEIASLIEPEAPAVVRGDPGRLRQVLTNLIGNAIKFTEEGEVVVRLGAAQEVRPNGHLRDGSPPAVVRFEVRDTGIGMTGEQQARLFRSFTQADASTTRRYGGTGLGLAISKQLVEMMNGEIGIQSEPGVGSTFWFTVRLEGLHGGSGGYPGLAGSAGGTRSRAAHPGLGGLRVLIVDDNATNREILGKQTASWGMVPRTVESGPEALEELRAAVKGGEPYPLAVLDMQMPDMGGMELARRIKTEEAISGVRLVMLTSMGRRGDGAQAARAGIEAYLTKPVRQSELYDVLATLVNEDEAGHDGASRRKRQPDRRTRPGRGEERGAAASPAAGPSARVLLAEDNPVNQKVAVRMLQRLGYEVDVAADGREALKALPEGDYDAVLMDVQMPEMDGYEATAEIRRREGGYRRTPVIAMTANALEGDREAALEAGMDDYISKPVKPEELDRTLRRWVKPGEAGDVAGEPAEGELLRELGELGDDSLLAEIVELFLEDTPRRLGALREAVAAGDADAVERAAHTLQGSSANMGAVQMSTTCRELREAGARGDLGRVPGLVDRLEKEFDRARAALRRRVEAR